MSIEAMKQAHTLSMDGEHFEARQILLDAIEDAEKQEPVAWMQDSIELYVKGEKDEKRGYVIPLYDHPQPKREPLTHEQAKALVAKYGHDPLYLVLQTEAAHGIKGDA